MGANLPWVHYGIDFGTNAWRPAGGISEPEERAILDITFNRLAASGVRWIRWFLFCDGRAGIRFTSAGRPTGLDDSVVNDLDVAVAAAGRHRLRIMFVLVDYLWCADTNVVRGVQLGGRSRAIADAGLRQSLLEQVFSPILERYGQAPEIFAWDIINEPEWIGNVEWTRLHAFVRDAAALIHSTTSHPATVGSAGTRWRDRYRKLDLDFFQFHWYDSLRHQPPLETPVARLGFDRPALLGEFPTRGSKKTPDEIVAAARSAGYSGAFYWSVLSKDDCSAG